MVDDSVLSNNSGSAISVAGGQATITASTLSGNTAGYGAALSVTHGGQATVEGSTLSGNSAAYGGGAIYVAEASHATVTGTLLQGNSTHSYGGAIYADHGQVDVTGSTLSENSAQFGGAIYQAGSLSPADSVTVATSTLSDNLAETAGGGIYIASGMLRIADSTVSDNIAQDAAGIHNAGSLDCTNSTLSGNAATRDAGGIRSAGQTVVRSSTITLNRADSDGDDSGDGGGLQLMTGASTTLYNSLVAGNLRGSTSDGAPNDIKLSGEAIAPESSYNLIGDPATAGGLVNGNNGNILGDGSGHLLDIHSILDTTLADNGGPTLTHKLVDASPAINAGDPLFDPNVTDPPLLYDQRGYGFDRVKDRRLDIGAYEGIANPVLPGGILQVGTFDDVLADDGLWSLREAVMYANSHPGDFTIKLSAGTYTLIRQGANEDLAFTGDLDVLNNGSLTILGAGAGTTTIDASGLEDPSLGYGDRIFDVRSGATFQVVSLTLTGGQLPLVSGGLYDGGAIRNAGSITVINAHSRTMKRGKAVPWKAIRTQTHQSSPAVFPRIMLKWEGLLRLRMPTT